MKYFYDTEFLDDGNTIEFISIGIVANDGREYYAVNRDADWERIHRDKWLEAYVVSQLPPESEWKGKRQIANEVKNFLLYGGAPELWAWYAAYDHVVLSQLWGRMLDIPEGLPHFTHDLRSHIPKGVRALPEQVAGLHDALEDARHVKVRYDFVRDLMVDATRERDFYRQAAINIESQVTDILAEALGYPEYQPGEEGYSPDRVNYVIGDHVSQSLAMEAARRLKEAEPEE